MTTATSEARLRTPRTEHRRPARRPGAPGRKPGNKRTAAGFAVLAVVTALVLLFIAPVLLVIFNAFKDPTDLAANGPLALPHGWHLTAIKQFWDQTQYQQELINSLLISLAVSAIALVLSLLNAFAIGIGRVRGRTFFLLFFLLANVVPQEGLIYPLYYLAKDLNLYDTRTVVILILGVTQSAFGTYLLSSVYATFPREILEAAALDGASKWRALRSVVIPISRPTLGVLFTFYFIWTWNEFLIPLVMLIDNSKQTVPLGLAIAEGQHTVDISLSSAGALLGILPAIVFFLLFQRTLTRGIPSGAVK